jgi:hypothetical protein
MKSITNAIRDNLISHLDWKFLSGGGLVNINIPSSGMYGGINHKLVPVEDANYAAGRAWQSHRNNWVWESGVSTAIPLSGVFVNGSFIPNGSGYHVNYKNGTIIFDTAIAVSSIVNVARSHKWIDFQSSTGHPWFREIQKLSNRSESPQLQNSSYGAWAQLGSSRIQLPAVIIDVKPPSSFKPFELGGGQYAYNDIIFTILSETDSECVHIMDNIAYGNDNLIYLYDTEDIAIANDFPIKGNGDISNSPKTYPELVNSYSRWFCYIHDMGNPTINELSPGLFMGTLRCTTETKPI